MKRTCLIICLATLATLMPLGEKAAAQDTVDNSSFILTPPAPDTPKVNGPKVYGERPGAPLMYRIPATGKRPMTFSAEGLPKGLKLDPESGIISGKVQKAGTYKITLKATNDLGSDERELRIVIGNEICLTPPLGWNSWNVWGNSVSQEKVISSARAMVERGLADCGWSYINIDDGWQGVRGGKHNAIQPNSKFPDMEGLAKEIHSMGLKFGIYSGPWVGTYAGHIGTSADYPDGTYDFIKKELVDSVYKLDRSRTDRKTLWYFGKYSFAKADAAQWADWGVDYLKYDWNPNDVYNTREMAEALNETGRDIVLSLSNSAPFALAPYWEKYCQAWRTTGDIRDKWESIVKIGFKGQDRWAQFKAPEEAAPGDVIWRIWTISPSRCCPIRRYWMSIRIRWDCRLPATTTVTHMPPTSSLWKTVLLPLVCSISEKLPGRSDSSATVSVSRALRRYVTCGGRKTSLRSGLKKGGRRKSRLTEWCS